MRSIGLQSDSRLPGERGAAEIRRRRGTGGATRPQEPARTSTAGSRTCSAPGDIDRVIIEWRSLLRQIAHAPDLEWPRWRALQAMAKTILNETESPTLTELPPLEYHQTRRVDHRLILRGIQKRRAESARL